MHARHRDRRLRHGQPALGAQGYRARCARLRTVCDRAIRDVVRRRARGVPRPGRDARLHARAGCAGLARGGRRGRARSRSSASASACRCSSSAARKANAPGSGSCRDEVLRFPATRRWCRRAARGLRCRTWAGTRSSRPSRTRFGQGIGDGEPLLFRAQLFCAAAETRPRRRASTAYPARSPVRLRATIFSPSSSIPKRVRLPASLARQLRRAGNRQSERSARRKRGSTRPSPASSH